MTSSSHDYLGPFESCQSERAEIVQYVKHLHECVTHWPPNTSSIEIPRPSCMAQGSSSSSIVRPITTQEIDTLSSICQCTCNSWEKIFVMYFCCRPDEDDDECNKNASTYLQQQYFQCCFAGTVILGVSKHHDCPGTDEDLPPGVQFNTRIVGSILEPNCTVYHNTIIANSFIGCSARVVRCGSIRRSKEHKEYLDLLTITVGPETGGGRVVDVRAEATMIDVIYSLMQAASVDKPITSHLKPCCKSPLNIILGSVSHIDTVVNIYSAFLSILRSCPSVSNTLLLPEASISHGCVVDSTILQWNATITDHSSVTSTVLMEHAHIGPHSLVKASIIGPDSHVSCGEVHCSVLGPNTNAHHQSLIISTLWPLGRGNVAYGCNIGSNHTGRLPDQEMISGEGIFYGLGSSLKFPLDLSRSPYSLLAAGTSLPPQRISMPFSLIVRHETSTNLNEIIPGWVIHYSPYTILRNEVKFNTRRKASRHKFYTGWAIVRPEIVNQCYLIREALLTLECDAFGQYNGKSLPALGLNVMTEKGKNIGIQAYTTLIQRYALHGLLQYATSHYSNGTWPPLNALVDAIVHQRREYPLFQSENYHTVLIDDELRIIPPFENHSLHHALYILLQEYPRIKGEMKIDDVDESKALEILFSKLVLLERNFVQRLKDSKKRDDERGQDIIMDYSDTHILADDDSTVNLASQNLRYVENAVKHFVISQI